MKELFIIGKKIINLTEIEYINFERGELYIHWKNDKYPFSIKATAEDYNRLCEYIVTIQNSRIVLSA